MVVSTLLQFSKHIAVSVERKLVRIKIYRTLDHENVIQRAPHWSTSCRKTPSGLWLMVFSIFVSLFEGYSLLRRVKIDPTQNLMQLGYFKNAFNSNLIFYFVSKTNIVIMSYDSINFAPISKTYNLVCWEKICPD
jgi:hypothetical protein